MTWNDRGAHALALALVGLCGGCANNAIRLDRAGTMTAAGREATASTRALIDEAVEANRSVRADIVALDPNCAPPEPVVASGAAANVLFCRPGQAGPGQTIRALSLQDAEPALAVIGALTSYLDAVDAVITRDAVDLVKIAGEAETDLRAVATVFGGGSALPSLTADQRSAIEGALALLGELADEAGRVEDLRELERSIEAKPSDSFDTIIASLKTANGSWVNRLNGNLGSIAALEQIKLQAIPATAYDARRTGALTVMDLREKVDSMPRLKLALDRAADELASAHASYLRLLNGRDQLTLSEKRKAAAVTRARLRGALRGLAALITAF